MLLLNKKYPLQETIYEIMPYIFLYCAILLHHSFTVLFGDDVSQYSESIKQAIENKGLIATTIQGYKEWSSRIATSFLFYFLLFKLPFIYWKIIDPLLYLLVAISFANLLGFKRKDKTAIWMIVFLILCFPLNILNSAGWITTTLAYFWPMAFAIFSLISLKKIYYEEKIKIYQYVIFCLALIIAAANEQVCAFLLIPYTCALVYFFKEKLPWKFTFLQFLIILGSLALIYLSPGVENRYLAEFRWFPDYGMLSSVDKLQLGISRILSYLIFSPNLIFFLLSLVTFLLVFNLYNDIYFRIIGFFPFACSLYFGISTPFSSQLSLFQTLSELIKYTSSIAFYNKYGLISINTIQTPYRNLFLIWMLLACILCLVLSLYTIFRYKKHLMVFTTGLIITGLANAVVLGFSPTVWASSWRTTLIMYFAFIGVILIIWKELYLNDFRGIKILNNFIILLSFMNYANELIFIITKRS